jgi:hypothetical protein
MKEAAAGQSNQLQQIADRLDELERKLPSDMGSRRLQAEQATQTLIQRCAELSGVGERDVERVLDVLGLKSLSRNLESVESPIRSVNDGRLFVSLISYRQLLNG